MGNNAAKFCDIMKLDCDLLEQCRKSKLDKKMNQKIRLILKKLDLDYILLTATKRRIIKHELMSASQTKFLVDKYKKLGLKVAIVRYKDFAGEKTQVKIPGIKIFNYANKTCAYEKKYRNRNNIVLAAHNFTELKRFINCEDLYSNKPQACFYIGYYLGYPVCCIKNHYKNIYKNGIFNEVAVDKKWKESKGKKEFACPLVNNIWPLFYHFYCDENCQETYYLVKKILAYVDKMYGFNFSVGYINLIKTLKHK